MLSRLPLLPGLLALALLPGWAASAWAQARGTSFSAGLDTRLGYNVNSRLGGLEGAEWIGEVTPSVRLQRRSGRVQGSLDYGLSLEGSWRERSISVSP